MDVFFLLGHIPRSLSLSSLSFSSIFCSYLVVLVYLLLSLTIYCFFIAPLLLSQKMLPDSSTRLFLQFSFIYFRHPYHYFSLLVYCFVAVVLFVLYLTELTKVSTNRKIVTDCCICCYPFLLISKWNHGGVSPWL